MLDLLFCRDVVLQPLSKQVLEENKGETINTTERSTVRRHFCEVLMISNLLQAAFVVTPRALVVSLECLGLSSNWRGGRGQGGRAQLVLPGAQVVLPHRAVLVDLMTRTLHWIKTRVEMKKLQTHFLLFLLPS